MTLVIGLEYLLVFGLILSYLIYKIIDLKGKSVRVETVYVDRSGIEENPPKKYIDISSNKTINFKLDSETIHINHLPWQDGIRYINKIYFLFGHLEGYRKYQPKGKIDEMKNNFLYLRTYSHIVLLVYKLAAPHSKNKRRLKKELFKRAKKDTLFTISLIQEIIDYWRYMGELTALLARGKTIRAMAGNGFTWRSYVTDREGRISIKRRFVPCTPMQNTSTTKQSEKTKN